LNFSKAFSASIERILWFLSLLLFICCVTVMDLHILKHTCIPGMKLLVMVYDHFDALLNSVSQYFVENLCVYIH
jgi:hypothetical protein